MLMCDGNVEQISLCASGYAIAEDELSCVGCIDNCLMCEDDATLCDDGMCMDGYS